MSYTPQSGTKRKPFARHRRSRFSSCRRWLAIFVLSVTWGWLLLPDAPCQTSAASCGTGVTTSVAGEVKSGHDRKSKLKDEHAAEDAFIEGARLLERNDREAAEKAFLRAAELAPDNRDYVLALAAIRESRVTELVQSAGKARLQGNTMQAELLLAQARKIDPNNALLLQHPDPKDALAPSQLKSWMADGPRIAGPIQLKPKEGNQNFHIHAAMPEVVRQVAAAYGIKASLDTSVLPRTVKFDLEDVPYAQAMHVLLQMGPLFAAPLASDSILVAVDNTENREKFDRQLQETIYAAGMTNEELAELGTMIRNVFGVKQLSIQNSFGTLVIRAPEETLRVLNLTLDDLLDGKSEVMLDLKLYSIDKSATRNIGVTLPTQAGAYNAYTAANQLVQANQSLVNQAIAQGLIPAGASNLAIAIALIESGLVNSALFSQTIALIGGGLNPVTGMLTTSGLFAVTGITSTISPTFNFALNSSDTRAIDEIQLRVGDRQSATFRAGSKYPITQSTYSTSAPTGLTSALAGATVNGVPVSSLLNSLSTSTIPQVQYEDLGLTLKATPTIQKSGLISVHLDLKIESLAGGMIDNIPVLNNDQLTSDVTIPDGGTAFLASNMTKNEAASVTGVPGLSELPGFQNAPELLRTTDTAQLLLVLTPHLVRKRSDISSGPRIAIRLPAASTSE